MKFYAGGLFILMCVVGFSHACVQSILGTVVPEEQLRFAQPYNSSFDAQESIAAMMLYGGTGALYVRVLAPANAHSCYVALDEEYEEKPYTTIVHYQRLHRLGKIC